MNAPENIRQTIYTSLNDIKRNAIAVLTEAYASNVISIDTFENAISNIESIDTIEGIKDILVQLNINKDVVAQEHNFHIGKQEKISSHGSKKVIDSKQLITKTLEVDIAHSKLVLDYSNLYLPEGEYDLVLKSIHSICVLMLPDDVHIDNRLHEVYSKVKDKRKYVHEKRNITIRLSGNLTHSILKIKKVKKRR